MKAHPHDYRPLSRRNGSPYYGQKLRVVLQPQDKPLPRAVQWYLARRWPSVALVVLGVALIGAALALILSGYGS